MEEETNSAGLPKHFEVLVIGTGLVESIVSAAVSRGGHSVLHLDPRDYYGGNFATLPFDLWTENGFASTPLSISSEGEVWWRNSCGGGVEQVWYQRDQESVLQRERRKFNIDVLPEVILAREDIIELLIHSDVSRYLEFLKVGRLFTNPPGEEANIMSIPLSRSDIFNSKTVSLGEKRMLVKAIEMIMNDNDTTASAQEQGGEEEVHPPSPPAPTFEEIAKSCKLSDKVKHLIKSIVERVEDGFLKDDDQHKKKFNEDFVSRARLYLKSIGRFGNQTPYLWPLYGVSEICQAFCRLSAVYGGIFILKRFVNSIQKTEDGLYNIKSEEDEFTAKHLVLGPEVQFPKERSITDDNDKVIGRAVIVVKGGSLKVEDDVNPKEVGICLYKIGQLQIFELSHMSQAVPSDYRLLQVTFPVTDNKDMECSPKSLIESKLQSLVDFHVESKTVTDSEDGNPEPPSSVLKPQAVYASYFWLHLFDDGSTTDSSEPLDCAVGSTDLNVHVSRAERIFRSMYPDEEFLPKPPPQEEPPEEDTIPMETEEVDASDNDERQGSNEQEPAQQAVVPSDSERDKS